MKAKILVVDDEQDITELVKNRLQKCGYDVITANDGKQALDEARRQSPDLVVLDIMMPVINGYEVCMQLKHDRKLRHIPVLVLTSRVRYGDKKTAEQCGADSYVPKPYCSDMLIDEVNKLLV